MILALLYSIFIFILHTLAAQSLCVFLPYFVYVFFLLRLILRSLYTALLFVIFRFLLFYAFFLFFFTVWLRSFTTQLFSVIYIGLSRIEERSLNIANRREFLFDIPILLQFTLPMPIDCRCVHTKMNLLYLITGTQCACDLYTCKICAEKMP